MKQFFDPGNKTKHLKNLCQELGNQYSIVPIDGEWVLYRDFDNGFNVEISGINSNNLNKKAVIYLWCGSNFIVFRFKDVAQSDISCKVEELYHLSQQLIFECGSDEQVLRNIANDYYRKHYQCF